MREMEVENLGPVSHLRIPIPEGGGLVVCRGRNGVGKTQVLNAVDTLLSGSGKLNKKDGEKSGGIEGHGVALRIRASTSRKGECDIEPLEDKLSIADIVDPGLIDPVAADRKRIKALIQVAAPKADAALFDGVLGEFKAVVKPESSKTDDLVQLAANYKRDLQEVALSEERKSEALSVQAKTKRESVTVDVNSGESDATILSARLESAIKAKTALETSYEMAADTLANGANAEADLAKIEGSQDSLTPQLAQANHEIIADELARAAAAVQAAKDALRKAEDHHKDIDNRLALAAQKLEAANQRELLVAGFRKAIATASAVAQPTEQELIDADRAVTLAREAVEQGARIRDAKLYVAQSDQLVAESRAASKRAEKLRDAAKSLDDVLSEAIGKLGTPLRVEDGRLVLDTDRKKGEFFADLSDGERIMAAFDIAIPAAGTNGGFVLKQALYQDLDPINRQKIANRLKGTHVYCYTAECTADEEINASILQPTVEG